MLGVVWGGARRLALVAVVVTVAGCGLFRAGHRSTGAVLGTRRLMVPVAGVAASQVTNTFDASRDGGRRRHNALDIFAPVGTPVLAADDGVVLALRSNHLGGRVIYATDPERRFVYYYAHLSRYHPTLAPGRRVARGDVIGYVGTTGNADPRSPHLHFQVMLFPPDQRWWAGTPVNPLPYFTRAGRPVTP